MLKLRFLYSISLLGLVYTIFKAPGVKTINQDFLFISLITSGWILFFIPFHMIAKVQRHQKKQYINKDPLVNEIEEDYKTATVIVSTALILLYYAITIYSWKQ